MMSGGGTQILATQGNVISPGAASSGPLFRAAR
jgi:hypothetical protein